MKILNAIHAQGIGGVDQVFRNYTEVLSDSGHEVGLVISDNGHYKYEAKNIFKLKNSSQVFDFIHLLIIVAKFKPDVILCHSNRLMKWMKILRIFSSAKSIAVNHGITFKHSLNCDFIISINKEIADMAIAEGFAQTKSFVLPNVIKVTEKYREKQFKKPPIIAMYGRLEPRKGFDVLINAAGILAKKGFDFRLKIGGFEVPSHYNWQTLAGYVQEQGISEKCEFVGVVIDKKKFFEDVDIFCVPSREEPFGLVILEGFLFSTLVISSDTDGGKFLVKNDETGLIFENGNIEDLAQKIEKISANPENYNNLTKKAFLRLEKEFSFDFLKQEFAKILQQISSHQ